MNVLYFGKDRPHATERYVKHALEQHGHDVRLIDAKQRVVDHRMSILKSPRRPDFVLFSKPTPIGGAELLGACKQAKIPTVCWQWDLYVDYRANRPLQWNADYLFSTDGGHKEYWRKHYPHHRTLRQGIHAPHNVLVPSDEYEYDVAFVGSRIVRGHPDRSTLIKELNRRYGDRFIHVHSTRGLQLNALLGRIKVVVGDSVPSRFYWSNRIYEIMGRGGVIMHPRVYGLEGEFRENEHYVGYYRNHWSEIFTTIDGLIADDARRLHIRDSGFRLMGERYTYTHRVAALLHHIGMPYKAEFLHDYFFDS